MVVLRQDTGGERTKAALRPPSYTTSYGGRLTTPPHLGEASGGVVREACADGHRTANAGSGAGDGRGGRTRSNGPFTSRLPRGIGVLRSGISSMREILPKRR